MKELAIDKEKGVTSSDAGMYRRGQWLLRNYWGLLRVSNPEYKGCFLSLIFHTSKTIHALFIICNSGTIFRTSFAPGSWCIILVFVYFKFYLALEK